MAEKNFILNADDFGITNDFNRGVLYAHNWGFLTSASLCANGKAFENAINEVLPECPNLAIGIHLNITSGKALTKSSMLTNSKGEFNNSYFSLIRKSKNKTFLKQVEDEFRAQIEKVLKYTQITHLNSHDHTHAIPEIFKITVKLAKEYNINYVRTLDERFYTAPNVLKHINFNYPINLFKLVLLKYYTKLNKQHLDNIKTNDHIIGIGYDGFMDNATIEHGLAALDNEDSSIIEAIIHPCVYAPELKNNHYKEFAITQDRNFEGNIYSLGYKITNYKNI